jgi:hypothetical protein
MPRIDQAVEFLVHEGEYDKGRRKIPRGLKDSKTSG